MIIPNEVKTEKEELVTEEQGSDFQSNKFYRKIDDIHKASFNNPNKTQDQKEEEMDELTKTRIVMRGIQKINKGRQL